MRALATALLLAACACSGGGGGGDAPPPAAPTGRVGTGLSPFAGGCGGTGGTVYINAEVEPHLAINPRDPNHLVAAWQQDRWSNGSARGVLAALSLDGGATWTITQPAFSRCAGGTPANGGDFDRATDPWVAFAADGSAVYVMALVTSGGAFVPGSANAMTVARSSDGGRTWSNPVALIRDTAPFFNDKNTLTADPRDARFLYAVWDRIEQNAGGPATFARTTDAGATWETARAIFDPGRSSQTIGNLIRVLPDGTLVNLFTQIDTVPGAPAASALRVIRSTDRGVSWSAPVTISPLRALGARDPATGQRIRDGSILAQMAVGPDGTLHVVWQDARFTGARDAIAYSRSADGGATWSAPARVNAEPAVTAFTPQVHVRADGVVGVSYYDLRPDTPAADSLLTDYWLARSADGAAWSETRLAGPFDLAFAPQAGGLFLGDYMGLESAGATFLALHIRANADPANRTDVFLTRVAPTAAARAYAAGLAKRGLEDDAALARAAADNVLRAKAERLVR